MGNYQDIPKSQMTSAGTEMPSSSPGDEPSLPIGTLCLWASSSVPAKYLEANGQAILRDVYPELFSVFGSSFGAGDGTTTFNLPDIRGLGIWGADGTNSAGTKTGSDSADLSHGHAAGSLVVGSPSGAINASILALGTPVSSQAHTHSVSGSTANSSQQNFDKRPARFYLKVIVRAVP